MSTATRNYARCDRCTWVWQSRIAREPGRATMPEPCPICLGTSRFVSTSVHARRPLTIVGQADYTRALPDSAGLWTAVLWIAAMMALLFFAWMGL